MSITAKTKICMVIGDPVNHSLSPQLHNAGYKALGIDNEYIFVGCRVTSENLSDFMKGVRTMNIRGISCTIPHKISIMQYLEEIDDTAKKIGAVNTIVNESGKLKGYNTDWEGIVIPIEKITSLDGKTVALIGAGGAAHGAAFGVTQKGAKLQIYNRTPEKGLEITRQFGGESFGLDEIEKIKNADIIINVTSVGLSPNENETPLPKEYISANQVIFDIIYTPYETRLLKDAKEQGATIIHGTEMFLQQGIEQFKLYTEHDAPVDAMRQALLNTMN